MKKIILIITILLASLQGNTYETKMKQGEQMNKVNYIKIGKVQVPLIFEYSGLLPIGFVGIVFNGGGSLGEKKIGLSSVSADLLNRGTKKKGEAKFANELESNAISLSVDNTLENLRFSIEFLKQEEDKALKALEELLSDPNTSKEAFNLTKLNLTSYLLSKENDFDYIASKNLTKTIFKDTKMANSALLDSATLEQITLKDVENYIKDTFILENVVVFAGGDIDLKSLESKLTKILTHIPNGKVYKSSKITPNANASEIVSKHNTKQAYIHFAAPLRFNSYEDELHKSHLMSFILGGSGFGSRIMEEVRVKRGLAYSAYCYNIVNNATSYMNGYLQTKLENKQEALKVVKEVVKEFIKNGVTQDELDAAKAYILGSQPLGEETLAQRVNKKYNNFSRGLSLDYNEILLQKIKNTTLQELNDYIKSHSETENITFSIVEANE